MAGSSTPERPTAAQLEEMLEAPDLTNGERRELKRMHRFQKRVELWEARRANPDQPRKLHRAVITVLMMGAMLWLLWLINSAPS